MNEVTIVILHFYLNEVNDGGVNVDNLDVNGDEEQNVNVDVEDEKGDDEKECENNDNQDQFQRMKRKRVSKAHADFSEVTSKNGSIKLQCIHCKTLLSKSLSATTSHLWNHLSVDIIDGVMKSTKDWGIEHKIFTISVDNASNNDVAVQIAKETFSRSHKIPLGGKLFHVRCTAHILNLVVQDGLSTIKTVVDDVRNSVRFINQSESRLLKFSEIVHHLGNPVKKLILDCVTRWNSTYEMLVVAIKVKDAFLIFAQRESSYKCCPS
nr:zinc finger BED domain-containing protein RICESLEEPER 2-like [Ipomoea batatas]